MNCWLPCRERLSPFCDATPFGQIVNKFSGDLEIVDQEVAPVLFGLQHAAFSALTVWILIAIITPLFNLPGLIVLLIYLSIVTL